MYASIIVALDGSEQSMLALNHARACPEKGVPPRTPWR
jgi:nucleotide-binding universal stress UspA family protein